MAKGVKDKIFLYLCKHGRLPFDQNFEIFETGTNGTEISFEEFQKKRKLLNFRKANHSTENSENSGIKSNGTEIARKKYFEIWVYLAKLSSFRNLSVQIPNFLLSAS